MKLIQFSIRRPVSVFIFAVAAVVFGMVAFNRLATDLLPDITYPSLTVQTRYEGAAPVEVESLITRPVENAVGVVNNVVRVISSYYELEIIPPPDLEADYTIKVAVDRPRTDVYVRQDHPSAYVW